MGDFISGVLGTKSKYEATPQQAGNSYGSEILQNEMNRRNQIYSDQHALAEQLQQQAAGLGPNPAQIQYQQNVDQNVANAQGMISGQRGLNPALAAKMGANMGAQANQQAAAQSGLMQMQQQLGAQANLGNLYGQMSQGNLGQQGLFNQANTSAMQTNAAVANANQQGSQGIVGGLMGSLGLGSVLGGGKAHGGMIHNYDDGGLVNNDPTQGDKSQPQSMAGKMLKGFNDSFQNTNSSLNGTSPFLTRGFGDLGPMGANPALKKGFGSFGAGVVKGAMNAMGGGGGGTAMAGEPYADAAMMMAAHGGKVPAMVSPGEIFIPPGKTKKVAEGKESAAKAGKRIPGKAKVPGDSLENDTVPKKLETGGVVVPRSESGSPDKARDFVSAILARENMRKKK